MTALPKLLQKPHIALEEKLDVVHAVLQNGDTVCAHAEGETGDPLRVVAIMIYELEDMGIDHAEAQNLDPSRCLARPARFAAPPAASTADETAHHHLRAGLGERKERGAELRLHA